MWGLSVATSLSLKTAAVSVRISRVILGHFLLHIIVIAFIFFGPYWLVSTGPILTLAQYQSSHVRSDHVLGLAMPNMFTTDLTLVFGVFCVQQVSVWNKGTVSTLSCISINDIKVKVKCSRYRPGVVQGVGRGIPLLFHDRGIGKGWVVSSTPRPQFSPGKDPVPIVQEAGWAPGRSGRAENLVPTGIRSRTVQSVDSRYTDWATRPTSINDITEMLYLHI